MNKLTFTEITVGTSSTSYKYDIELTLEQYIKLKASVPTEFIDNLGVTFIKDGFKNKYYISIIAFFLDFSPFETTEQAREFMTNNGVFLLFSKVEALSELCEVRRLLVLAGVVVG